MAKAHIAFGKVS